MPAQRKQTSDNRLGTAKSQVVSLRLKQPQMDRLRRMARRFGTSASEAGALLIEEALRRAEFAFIDFRDSAAGRQPYLQGSSLAVWEVLMVAENLHGSTEQTADHLDCPVHKVQAALNYARAFPEEITAAIEDNRAFNFERLSQMVPQAEEFVYQPARSAGMSKGTEKRSGRKAARK